MWKIGGIMEKINRKELKKSKKLVKFMWKGRKEVYIIKNKVIQKREIMKKIERGKRYG